MREWPLIGRSEELAVIRQATRVADGACGIVLSGAAGVGKTRLAREAFAGCRPRGGRRRWIAGTASARSVPLGAFADIAASFGPDPLRRVREVIDGLLGGRDRAVVVGVDDAHLLDDLSAFTVHQLVSRRLATVILTIRSGESPPDAITAIWKDQHLERLELQPLSLAETAQLAEQVLGGPVQSGAARRLWQFTQGNVLYLHHLIRNEINASRITRYSGVWLWEGQPTLSPALTELIEARMAQAPEPVRNVLDALAVNEPLDLDVLAAITDPDAPAQAESLGLVRVDTRANPAAVWLAHPLFGEVRRTGALRLRRLRGRIATELARKPDTDPRDLVRRAVLTIESDLAPNPDLLTAAASAAMQLHDVRLAETLAERAIAAGAGLEAKMNHAMVIAFQERATEAETILAELADQTSGPARAQIAIVRALNFAAMLGDVAHAERELDKLHRADDDAAAAQPIATAVQAVIDVMRGDARAAVDRASTVVVNPLAGALARMISVLVLTKGLGDLGRIDDVELSADRGYALADSSAEVSHLRLPLAHLQTSAYRLAGALTRADATVTRVSRDMVDVPLDQFWHGFLNGIAAMSRGTLADAQRLLRESLAFLGTDDSGYVTRAFARLWLTTVTGMAGQVADARREFETIESRVHEPAACLWDWERPVAQAWVCAAEGATSQAISIIRDAAQRESRLGRPACEVLLLQTATQFGDPTTAPRLAELAGLVQGPRAPAAAAHAAALAAGDGDALLDVSHRYEAFGDRIAAADAAAHAAVTYRNSGLRGAALTASATARRLAEECQGADTPALRAATMPLPITARQREIITLAAEGLSNTEIAERLTMSVRSVQGHLFRASQRVGVNSRDELIAILQGP